MGTEPTRLGSSGRDAPKRGAEARLRGGGPGRGSEDRGGACGAQTRSSRRTVGRSWRTAALREPWDSWLESSSRRFWGCGCCCAAGGASGAPSCGPRRIRSVGDGVGGSGAEGVRERAPRRAAATQCTRPRGRDARQAARAKSTAQDAVFLVRDSGSLSVSQGPCLLGLVDVPTRGMGGGEGIGVGGRLPSVLYARLRSLGVWGG